MELADRAVGLLLSLISLSIFTYYTFWVIILVILPCLHFALVYTHLHYYSMTVKKPNPVLICSTSAAFCRQRSFHPQVLPPPGIRHPHTRFCWSGAHRLLVPIHWVCDAQIQEEESTLEISLPTILTFKDLLLVYQLTIYKIRIASSRVLVEASVLQTQWKESFSLFQISYFPLASQYNDSNS